MKLLAWFRWTWWIAQARVWYKGMKRFAQGEWLAWCQVPVTSRGLASALQPCLLVLPQALLTCSECSSWLPASCTSLQLPCCSQAASVPCRLCCWNAEFEDKVIFLKEIFFSFDVFKSYISLLWSSNLHLRSEFNVNLHLPGGVVVVLVQQGWGALPGTLCPLLPKEQWKVFCTGTLGFALCPVVLVMDKQRERLWKAGCENSSASLLTQRGVMCRAELLPLFSFPPLPPLFPCCASCMLWHIGAVSPLLPSRFSRSSSVLFSVVFPLPPVFLHVFVHSGWRLFVGWVCYKFFWLFLFGCFFKRFQSSDCIVNENSSIAKYSSYVNAGLEDHKQVCACPSTLQTNINIESDAGHEWDNEIINYLNSYLFILFIKLKCSLTKTCIDVYMWSPLYWNNSLSPAGYICRHGQYRYWRLKNMLFRCPVCWVGVFLLGWFLAYKVTTTLSWGEENKSDLAVFINKSGSICNTTSHTGIWMLFGYSNWSPSPSMCICVLPGPLEHMHWTPWCLVLFCAVSRWGGWMCSYGVGEAGRNNAGCLFPLTD